MDRYILTKGMASYNKFLEQGFNITLKWQLLDLLTLVVQYESYEKCFIDTTRIEIFDRIRIKLDRYLYNLNVIPMNNKYKYEQLFTWYDATDMKYITWRRFDRLFLGYQNKLIASTIISDEQYDIFNDWLIENTTDLYTMSGGIIGFANEEDAAMFMLRWN